MPPKLFVGSSALIGALEQYARRLDLLELAADELPSPRTLRRWRETVRPDFRFSVVLPRDVSDLGGARSVPPPASEQPPALESALSAARDLAAAWLVLRTPPAVAPSERSKRRIAEFVDKLRQGTQPARIAWEPRGLWADEDAEELAAALGVVLVRDLAQSEPAEGPLVYSRLRTIGQQSRLGQAAIERVAERLIDAEEAFVVVEGRGAPGVARRLRGALAIVGPSEEEGEGSGEEEGDFEGDEDDIDEAEDGLVENEDE